MSKRVILGIIAIPVLIMAIFIGCHQLNNQGRTAAAFPDESVTFPAIYPELLGEADASIHDRYFTIGPDGRKYRTWHPVTVPVDPNDPDGPQVTFAHNHGDPPHPDAPLPCFGYVAFHSGQPGMIKQHRDYKVFTHKTGQITGWDEPEVQPVSPDWDMQFWIHQGFSNALDGRQYRSAGFWSQDPTGNETEVYFLADNDQLDTKVADFLGTTAANGKIENLYRDGGYQFRSFAGNIANVWDCPVNVIVRTATEDPGAARFTDRRILLNPEWEWMNQDGPVRFFTDVYGNLRPDSLAGQVGIIPQRVAPVRYSAGVSASWDRTEHHPLVGMENRGIDRLAGVN